MTTYTVKIPDTLTNLVGPQIVRAEIEDALREVFDEWAKPELVKRIRVVKPRGGQDE